MEEDRCGINSPFAGISTNDTCWSGDKQGRTVNNNLCGKQKALVKTPGPFMKYSCVVRQAHHDNIVILSLSKDLISKITNPCISGVSSCHSL